MTTSNHGNIVVVDFPATSGQPGKRRPALIVFDSGDADCVIAKLTTRGRNAHCDVPLVDWAAAGLRAPSVVRLHKLLTIEKTMVIARMGAIFVKDRKSISAVLKTMFGNW